MNTIRILFLTQLSPCPPTSGSAVKTYNILKHLGSQHEVIFLTFIRNESEAVALSQIAQYCRELDFCMIERSSARNLVEAARSLLAGSSFIITRDRSSQMEAKVRSFLRTNPDLIYVDHLQMFQFVPNLPPCPVLLDNHNVEWQIIERFSSAGTPLAQRIFASMEWRKIRRYELDACRKADAVTTVTSRDKDILVANGVPPAKVTPIPVGVDTDYFRPVRPSAETSEVLTFGTLVWPPNADAVLYFSKSIYPLIKRKSPDVRFTVVGASPPAEIVPLGARDPSVRVTGYVDDIRNVVEGTAAFVVPLRIGSGMRVKILDAMAMGLPVVTTSIGCEGISLRHGEHALVADTPEDFADAVIHLLRNPSERMRLGAAGRSLVESMYSWPPILRRLDKVLSRVRIQQ